MSTKPAIQKTNLPPSWAFARPKPLWQSAYDFCLAPARMLLLPDHRSEQLRLTSLRSERFAAVLPELHGRVLDIGAGDNALVRLWQAHAQRFGGDPNVAASSVGVDVVDWGSDCTIVPSSANLPFPDASFDTVTFIACLNHIPERRDALLEAQRVLRPGGRVVLTMIGKLIGTIGHALWWYSEDKHREVDAHEEMGLDRSEMLQLLRQAGFKDIRVSSFFYGLNSLYVAHL